MNFDKNVCILCFGPETEEMVQCDSCDQWYHFDCVGVDAGIADKPFNCDICINRSITPDKNNNQSISMQNVQSNAALKTLPELEYLLDKAVKLSATNSASTNAATTTTSMFLSNASKTATATTNATANNPLLLPKNTSRQANVTYNVQQQARIFLQNKSDEMFYDMFPHLRQAEKNRTETSHAHQAENIRNEKVQNRSAQKQTASIQLELQMLEEENKLKKEYLQRKYEILAKGDDDTNINKYFLNSFASTGPTSAQIAARQILPKELPTFDGDPEDWPLFISAYENATSMGGFTNGENLMRLQVSLKGKARDMVKSKLLVPAMVPDIIKTLKMCFGRPELIVEKMVDNVRQMPAPKDKLESLIEYALAVKNVCATMEACNLPDHLNNPMLVRELVNKLSSQYKLNWAMHPKGREPIVTTFSNWLHNLAEAAATVVTPYTKKKTSSVNVHTDDTNTRACLLCKADHKLTQCQQFHGMSHQVKWDFVKSNKLCRQCLGRHNRKCLSDKKCNVGDCGARHHPLLHQHSTVEQHVGEHAVANVNTHDANKGVLFRIVPIKLMANNKCVQTYAFLDEGSSVTLAEDNIFDKLGIQGQKDPLCLRWTGDTIRREDSSRRATIKIVNVINDAKFTLNDVHTVRNLDLPKQSINMEKLSEKYAHLKKLPIKSYENVKPTVLIGANNWKLAVPLKIREGFYNQPIATKTRLGWAVQGATDVRSGLRHLNIHTCECENYYNELDAATKKFFELESDSRKIISKDDELAIQTLDKTCKFLGDRYEIGFPWRNEAIELPESYQMAHQRLMCMQRKFKKDPSKREQTQREIDNLVNKGYARKISHEESLETPQRIWYLPIFTTVNPNKPNRVRLVWDAAAKSSGKSLNDFLLTGPDLLTPLMNILLAFRIGEVAICADISEMFHQIRVRKEDMHSQRFLWSENGKPDEPSIYVMEALTFGLNCAPCISHYIRDKNADRFAAEHPRAVSGIKKSHYVDDFIDCTDSEEEALQLAIQVKTIHQAGGFYIRNWVSNALNVARQLNGEDSTTQQPFRLDHTEKILGMYWEPNNDVFKYNFRFLRLKRNVMADDVVPTKRELLQVLMSLFDPLGFISCHTIRLKMLLQEVWRSGISWDECLNEDARNKWELWKRSLVEIAAISIPRLYSTMLKGAKSVQLHVFVDAGEEAYAAVCYLRVQNGDRVDITLVAAKAKVAPLKPMTIPRLELQAAVTGVKLAEKIKSIENLQITSCTYWTDSKTVLRWLRMDPRGFHQFVMYRVGEILELTNPHQWRWVPSKQNVADLATKVSSKLARECWFSGPKFLASSPNEWPYCGDLGPIDETEMRRVMVHQNGSPQMDPKINVTAFSSWRRLYRALANFILYVAKLQARITNTLQPQLSTEMIERAKTILYRQAQNEAYSDEIHALQCGKPIKRSSELVSLNVYLDKDGILRARGRLEYLLSNEDTIILPRSSYITLLVVRFFHERNHHLLHEASINTIRSKFYVPKLRVLYKTVRKSCQKCKIYDAQPQEPQMAPIPKARLGAFQRPFTFTGIDYFGPISVTVGRRTEKRWGVVFTCLTLRAIHIEIAHTLDTSSCLMCIENFISRRGTPKEIFTDNGTNFRAAERVLKEHYQSISYSTIEGKHDEIKWRFNPPLTPHMGGAWERLIRSIKTVLYRIIPNGKFSDESLRHAMCEVEFIINSRPLTFVSLDAADDEALTPNHLLLGSPTGVKPVPDHKAGLRNCWLEAQKFANEFWARWLAEYTPTLARRTKWFDKRAPLKAGDVVIIIDSSLPRNCWPKGIIESVTLAKDGQVRRATVRTQHGTLERPAVKLVILDVGNLLE